MTKTHSALRTPHSAILWAVFAVFVVFVYFFGLTIPLVGPDEPRYAQIAREMFERGDWITPTLGGFNWFEKPALLYWLQIAAYQVFGVSEFSARFGSALFGLGTILSLWILGRFLATENTEKTIEYGNSNTVSINSVSDDFSNWLALIAASTIGIIVFSRGASFDIILTFPMTAALVSFYIFDSRVQPPATAGGSDNPAASPRLRVSVPLIAFYFFIGVSLLAKGLIGIVFPFAIVGFYYILSRRLPSKTFLFSVLFGTLLSFAVASAWYLPMYLRHGWTFIDEFFIQHHFQRYTSNKYFHPQPFHFFFWVLPLMTIPWVPFFVAAVWDFIKAFFKNPSDYSDWSASIPACTDAERSEKNPPAYAGGSDKALLLFSIAWIAVPLVFFSFSGSKLPGYILPTVPPAIILTAEFITRFTRESRKWRTLVGLTAAATFLVVIAVLIFVVPQFADGDSVKGLIVAADERGYQNAKVLTLHTISHNAEFYAPGRLVRTEDGKQKYLTGPEDVLQEIRRNGDEPVVVLVPLTYLKDLTGSKLLKSEVLRDNGELAVAIVTAN